MMKRYQWITALLCCLSLTADAGFPPTTSKAIGDANNVTTFNFQFPGFNVVHNGITAVITDPGSVVYGVDTGAANAYVVSGAGSTYVPGKVVSFVAANANTSASTINVNSIGVVALQEPGTGALVIGDILAGQMVSAIYDGTAFQMISPQGPATTVDTVNTMMKRGTLNEVQIGQLNDDSGQGIFFLSNDDPHGDSHVIDDSSGTQSIRYNSRILEDNNMVQSINWASRYGRDSSNDQSFDYENRKLTDNNEIDSVDWESRRLKDASGNDVGDWNTTNLFIVPGFQDSGLTTGVGHLDASGNLGSSAVVLSGSEVSGNLGVSHLNSGTSASSTTFWRGDATWASVGTVTSVNATVPSFLSVSGVPITGSGTIAITYSGTALPIANGGTGQTTATAAFNALSPMTTGGDIIYGGTSGAGTRLANGSAGQVLTSAGGTLPPTWGPAGGGNTLNMTATLTSDYTTSGAGDPIKYDTVLYDTNSASATTYSTSTGFFTAPFAGKFHVSVDALAVVGTPVLEIYVNGSPYTALFLLIASTQTSGSATVALSMNDTISIAGDLAKTYSHKSGSTWVNLLSIDYVGP